MPTVWVEVQDGLWRPQEVETFEEAAELWMETLQKGQHARIDERVLIKIERQTSKRPGADKAKKTGPGRRRGLDKTNYTGKVLAVLKEAGEALTAHQIAQRTGITRHYVSSTVSYLVKTERVTISKVSPSAERGVTPPGRTELSAYTFVKD